MLDVDPFQSHVAARLLDFYGSRTPWHRLLWNTGTVLSLHELREASEAASAAVLSQNSVKFICRQIAPLAASELGVAREQKKLLDKCLKSDLKFKGMHCLSLQQITEDIESRYLERWSALLDDSKRRPGPERTARAIASHLLDSGFSPDYLHRWWTFKIRHEKGLKSLAELVSEAHALVRQPDQEFEVLVAFEGMPESRSGSPSEWLNAPAVSNWLRSQGYDVSGLRQNGGLLIKATSRDAGAAVESAVEFVDRLESRVILGTNKKLNPLPWAWVAGEREALRLRRRNRNVEVRALYREDQLYCQRQSSIVDAAIELLGPLSVSSPGPAVAGAWAAIEAMLSGPGDSERGVAGDRMAALVACSYSRAELTALSYKVRNRGLRQRLSACQTNQARAQLLAKAIQDGEKVSVGEPSDIAAVARIQEILANPGTRLQDINSHLVAAFRRLYRQRNIVLHWGKTDAVALRAGLRTVAPLVGAGMDRVAHAWFVEEMSPLELAARARVRLGMVDSPEGNSIVDLLD